MKNPLVKFNLEITMPLNWANKFIQMLDCMRWFSKTGASRVVAFYADGDGDFKNFDFKIENQEMNKLADWSELDIIHNQNEEITPPFKTKRSIDFFFDAS